jgi:MFS family permease
MSDIPEINDATRRRNLVAACASVVIFGFAMGLTYPLLSLLLERRGVPEAVIGMNAAMAPLGILISSLFIPLVVRRIGSRNTCIIAALIAAFILVFYKLFPSLEAWFVLRFFQGVTVSTLFVLSESWVVKFAEPGSRGKVVAIYGAALAASFGAGPAMISIVGIDGWLPFLLGACVMFATLMPLMLVQDPISSAEPHADWKAIVRFVPQAPILLAAVFLFAVFDAGTLSLIPVYGVQVGYELAPATNMLTVLIIGNVVLLFPVGWLIDRLDRRKVLAGLAALTLILLLLIPLAVWHWLIWPILLFVGASGYGIYTCALAILGDRYTGHDLIVGSSAFATMWGSGALFGSLMAGSAMQTFGPHGLPISLSCCFAIFLLGMWTRRHQQQA